MKTAAPARPATRRAGYDRAAAARRACAAAEADLARLIAAARRPQQPRQAA